MEVSGQLRVLFAMTSGRNFFMFVEQEAVWPSKQARTPWRYNSLFVPGNLGSAHMIVTGLFRPTDYIRTKIITYDAHQKSK
jgi:hypothetical protein